MKKILVFLVTVASLVTIASPVKSNDAAKGIGYIDEDAWNPSAADYIQDGLVAMWDGIENVGWGEFAPDATSWIDLVNGVPFVPVSASRMSVGPSYINVANTGMRTDLPGVSDIFASHNFSFQVVLRSNSDSTAATTAFCSAGVTRPGFTGANSASGLATFGTLNAGSWGTGMNAGYGSIVSASYVAMPISNDGTRVLLYKGSKYIGDMGRAPDKSPLSSNRLSIGINAFNPQLIAVDMDYFSVRIYNRALSAEEVAYNNEIDKMRFGL